MRIQLLTPEHPAQRDGGSGSPVGRDVEALAKAYKAQGHDVRITVPLYTPPDVSAWKVVTNVKASFLRMDEAQILGGNAKWPHVRLVHHPILQRNHPYLDDLGFDHSDNALRFAVFCASALIDCAAENWIPDVIHAHEWQSGLAVLYAQNHLRGVLGDVRLLFSFQDAAFQGLCDASWVDDIGLGREWLNADGLEFWGRLNLLKSGLVCSHKVTLPSQQYLHDILVDSHGYGLEGLFRSLAHKVSPVNPGVDDAIWNLPESVASDPAALHEWKRKSRMELVGGNEPLLVFASSFKAGKGIDHVLTLMPDLLKMDVRVAVVGGHGTEEHRHLEAVAANHPDRIHLFQKDDATLLKVLKGADLLLLPVAHQPGGVLFARAMAMGTPTLAHRVGAAADQIVPFPKSGADGFLFDDLAPDTLLKHLRKALQLRANTTEWSALCSRAALRNFSWAKVARTYLDLVDGGA